MMSFTMPTEEKLNQESIYVWPWVWRASQEAEKVIEILNKFGHSISYHGAEMIETEPANEIVEKQYSTMYTLIKWCR